MRDFLVVVGALTCFSLVILFVTCGVPWIIRTIIEAKQAAVDLPRVTAERDKYKEELDAIKRGEPYR